MPGSAKSPKPSVFACPECQGVLLKLKEGGRIRFRCHRAWYSFDSLVSGISESAEQALWNAIRALEEADMLMRGMSEHMKAHDMTAATSSWCGPPRRSGNPK